MILFVGLVARKTLEKLMEAGRVHPAIIEETTHKTRKEILSRIKEDGEKTCFDAGVHDVHSNIINVLGSLRYRFIEGQNLLKYSVESSDIAALIAGELSWGEKLAKRAVFSMLSAWLSLIQWKAVILLSERSFVAGMERKKSSVRPSVAMMEK